MTCSRCFIDPFTGQDHLQDAPTGRSVNKAAKLVRVLKARLFGAQGRLVIAWC
jgi:hypothetical protein